MRLNGWQRLWVLIAIIYLIPIAIITINSFPTKNQIYNKWYEYLYSIYYIANEKTDNEGFLLRSQIKNLDQQQKIIFLEASIRSKQHIDTGNEMDQIVYQNARQSIPDFRKTYEADLNELPSNQKEIITISLLIWIVPLVIVYIFGLILKWVYKGFKPK